MPVTILPGAYQKMIMHVLRFGSSGIPKDQWRECYGMLIGKFTKDQGITVTDVLASTHGSDIGVEFMEKNYVLMAEFQDQLDKMNADVKNPADQVFIVGWYHSHPGMERFLSSVDVRNQIAYQTSAFPFGIAIVFDNTCLFQTSPVTGELDLGFKIFRLDDPTSIEVNIPFSDVPFDRSLLDRPELIEIWKNEMSMIENVQKRSPIIKEFQETPSVFGDFKLPTTNELKDAGTGITEHGDITVLALTDLDQIFTRAMQLFASKYKDLPDDQKRDYETLIENGVMPVLDKITESVIGGLNTWTVKLREDVDKRVNYGIATLSSLKDAMAQVQDEYLAYLKQLADQGGEHAQQLSKDMTQAEIEVKKVLKEFKDEHAEMFKQMGAAWRQMLDSAKVKLGQTELAGIRAQLEALSKGAGNTSADTAPTADSKVDVQSFGELLASHLAQVNATLQEAQANRSAQAPPPLLGNFTIPKTSEVGDMTPFVDNGDEVTADFIKIEEIPAAFRDGFKEFTNFYDSLSPEQRDDFAVLNEKGIQPFSDKVVSSLVKGINQWTVGLRDDIDRRVNLLVSITNEMSRTMRNMQSDYNEFMLSVSDPVAKIAREVQKVLSGLETTTLTTYNSVLTYMQQVMENLIYYYQQQLTKQKEALDAKELKNISKTLDGLKKSMK
jgi:proteasome lid subunit RPN8/RPN11